MIRRMPWVDRNANHADNVLVRLAALWAPADNWAITPSVYYQNRNIHDVSNLLAVVFEAVADDVFVSGQSDAAGEPGQILPAGAQDPRAISAHSS